MMKLAKDNVSNNNTKATYWNSLENNAAQAYDDYESEAEILQRQIQNPTVFNVAVVANNGAGKSSVIATFLNKYRNRKKLINLKKNKLGSAKANRYTRVTLATFNENDYDEISIERSILQQLLYSRKKSELPNSKIERTNKSSWTKSLSHSTLIVSMILSLIFTVIAFTSQSNSFHNTWVKYLLLGITIILAVAMLFIIIHYKSLKKIKYKDLEAQFCEDNNTNSSEDLINKFIDEVIYFFECVNIDLVIFEDLDRLPTSKIFIKLRELNTIINNSQKRSKKVTFLYAVRNDLFKTEEERAKFFEFILPIVPVLNPLTAFNKLEEHMDKIEKSFPLLHLLVDLAKEYLYTYQTCVYLTIQSMIF